VVRYLLRNRAFAQARDDLKQTPLHLACAAGEGKTAALIIEYMGRMDQQDAIGQTPLHLALIARKDSAVRALLKLGAQLPKEYADKPEMQPLIREVEKEMVEEALDEAKSATPERIQELEKSFEDARKDLLQLVSIKQAARFAPVFKHCQDSLREITEQAKSHAEAEMPLRRELEATQQKLQDLQRLNREAHSAKEAASRKVKSGHDAAAQQEKQLDAVKADFKAKQEDLRRTREQAAKVDKSLKDNVARSEQLRAALEESNEENRGLREQLQQVQQKVDHIHDAHEKIHAIHNEARTVAGSRQRRKGSPGRPASRSLEVQKKRTSAPQAE